MREATARTAAATRIALVAGAAGSLALMLYAGRRQPSRILMLFFAIWVLSPFAGAVWAHAASKRRAPEVRMRIDAAMRVVTAASLAAYAGVAFGYLHAKTGTVFLMVPLAAWVVLAIALKLTGRGPVATR